jgi:hypothetical protein
MNAMTSRSPSAMQRYAKLLLQLDELMSTGKGNGPAADEVREQMEEPWYAMTESEQERARGLSEDLYALMEGEKKSVSMSPADRIRWAQEAKTSLRDSDDPDVALAFLRRPFPQGGPAFAKPFLQARCWERLGDLEVALRFMRAAEQLDRQQAICVLILLDKLGRSEEAEQYARRILDERSNHMLSTLSAS